MQSYDELRRQDVNQMKSVRTICEIHGLYVKIMKCTQKKQLFIDNSLGNLEKKRNFAPHLVLCIYYIMYVRAKMGTQ